MSYRRQGITNDWLTPQWVIEALGGAQSFDLDPCTPLVQPYPTARARFTQFDNGLIQRWFGRVWLNPPYSTALFRRFLGRMAVHNCGLALIPVRTDTEAFRQFVWPVAAAARYLHGRMGFCTPDGRETRCSGEPSVIIAYGMHDVDVLAACGIPGEFHVLRLPRAIVVALFEPSWRDVVLQAMRDNAGPVALGDLYRAIAVHPKTRTRRHWRAKVRQVLQNGPFERVNRGVWRAA